MTVLDSDEIRSILSLYHLEELEDFGTLRGGAPAYWVRVAGKTYLLRITDDKCADDMIFEKEMLVHLDQHRVPVPRLVKNVAHGTFTPWAVHGRYASLFEPVPGRFLGVFEIRKRHTRAAGLFLARMHEALKTFHRHRDNPFTRVSLRKTMDRIVQAYEQRRLARRFGPDIERLSEALAVQEARVLDDLPFGAVHGAFDPGRVMFEADRLVGVVDFQYASTERWIWDVARAVNAWCWEPAADSKGHGPAGRFDPHRVRSFVRAYHHHRNLDEREQAELANDLRLAALETALLRFASFELEPSNAENGYRDYGHYMARLSALADGEAERLVTKALAK